MFKKTVLDSGLRIITAPMQGTNTVTSLVLCGTGSDYETRETNGISHFLEHIFFKGTRKRPHYIDIMHEIDSMGSVVNAFTAHEITGYHVKAAKINLTQSLDLLADIYKNSQFPEEEIERERQVVIEEMHKDYDTPTLYIWWAWEHLLYGDTPQGWDVIGTEANIRRFTRDEFAEYFKSQYVASNTAVVLAGNFDEEKAISLVKKFFGDIRSGPPIRQKPAFVEAQTAPAVKIVEKNTDQTHITIGFRSFDASHPRRYAAEVLASILGGSWSSRMFDRIREKMGLAYHVRTVHESYSNRGYLVTYAGVANTNVEKTIRATLEEYRKVCDTPVTETELRRIKDYIRGTTLIGLEASDAVAAFVGTEEMVTGSPLTADEVFAKIEAVTPKILCDVAKEIIRPERLNLALLGPHKDGEAFQKMLNEF